MVVITMAVIVVETVALGLLPGVAAPPLCSPSLRSRWPVSSSRGCFSSGHCAADDRPTIGTRSGTAARRTSGHSSRRWPSSSAVVPLHSARPGARLGRSQGRARTASSTPSSWAFSSPTSGRLRAVVGPVGRNRIRSNAGDLRRTSDPIVVTVVLDNATSVAGTVLALLGLALHQATGAPVFDALAGAGIGVLLIVVAAALLVRGRELITGRASTRSSTSKRSSPGRARSS
jgi:hypothetical protein